MEVHHVELRTFQLYVISTLAEIYFFTIIIVYVLIKYKNMSILSQLNKDCLLSMLRRLSCVNSLNTHVVLGLRRVDTIIK